MIRSLLELGFYSRKRIHGFSLAFEILPCQEYNIYAQCQKIYFSRMGVFFFNSRNGSWCYLLFLNTMAIFHTSPY